MLKADGMLTKIRYNRNPSQGRDEVYLELDIDSYVTMRICPEADSEWPAASSPGKSHLALKSWCLLFSLETSHRWFFHTSIISYHGPGRSDSSPHTLPVVALWDDVSALLDKDTEGSRASSYGCHEDSGNKLEQGVSACPVICLCYLFLPNLFCIPNPKPRGLQAQNRNNVAHRVSLSSLRIETN